MIDPYDIKSGPTTNELLRARKLMDIADASVNRYFQQKMKDYPSTYASVYAGSQSVTVNLTGQGKVWKNEKGHRVYKRTSVPYGDLAALDAKIEEAKLYYRSLKKV